MIDDKCHLRPCGLSEVEFICQISTIDEEVCGSVKLKRLSEQHRGSSQGSIASIIKTYQRQDFTCAGCRPAVITSRRSALVSSIMLNRLVTALSDSVITQITLVYKCARCSPTVITY